MEKQRNYNSPNTLVKGKQVGRFIIPDFKTNYEGLVIKTLRSGKG